MVCVEKYSSFGTKVNGLFFGERDSESAIDFFNSSRLVKEKLKDLRELLLVKTIHIINRHVNS